MRMSITRSRTTIPTASSVGCPSHNDEQGAVGALWSNAQGLSHLLPSWNGAMEVGHLPDLVPAKARMAHVTADIF